VRRRIANRRSGPDSSKNRAARRSLERSVRVFAERSEDNGVMSPPEPAEALEQIRAYLLEEFSSVTIAPLADAKTGSALIHILQGRTRWAVEITHSFLDADKNRPEPLAAVRKWNLIGELKKAESGSIIRVTTTGLRLV